MLDKLNNIPRKKLFRYAVALLLTAVILCIYLSTLDKGGENAAPKTDADLEDRLENALCNMEGVGRVSVVINYESTAELVPARVSESSAESSEGEKSKSSSSRSSDNVASLSGDALIIKENQPKVRGVIVIAQGARDIAVRNGILNAVMTLLDVTADKVEILY